MQFFQKRTNGLPLIPGVNIYIITPVIKGSPFVLFLKRLHSEDLMDPLLQEILFLLILRIGLSFLKRTKGLPLIPGVNIYK